MAFISYMFFPAEATSYIQGSDYFFRVGFVGIGQRRIPFLLFRSVGNPMHRWYCPFVKVAIFGSTKNFELVQRLVVVVLSQEQVSGLFP